MLRPPDVQVHPPFAAKAQHRRHMDSRHTPKLAAYWDHSVPTHQRRQVLLYMPQTLSSVLLSKTIWYLHVTGYEEELKLEVGYKKVMFQGA